MKKVFIKKTGQVKLVDNGLAHGMIERGEAELVAGKEKSFDEAPKDKMIHGNTSKTRKK